MPALRFGPLDYAAILAFLAYSASAIITPICLIILAEELKFSLVGGGGLEFARGAIILIVLLGSGFASARWGKAVSIGASLILLGAGLFAYAVAPTYGLVVAAVALLGVAGGILEGLINPLVHDLHPNDSGRYLSIINAFWSVGVLVTVLVSGELLTRAVSWRSIAGGLGAFSVAAGVLFLYLARLENHRVRHDARSVFGHKWQIVRRRRFWVFVAMMVLAGAAEGAFTFWSASYIQINYAGLPRAGGIGTASFAGGMMIARFAWGGLIPQQHLRTLILWSAVGGTVVSVVVPFIESLNQLYVVLFLAGIAIACFWPSIEAYAGDRMPVDLTALFVLLSCAGIPGFALASWLMGYIGDQHGLRASFSIVPVMLAGLSVLVWLEGRNAPR